MRVRVRLFASLGRYLTAVRPGAPAEIEVPAGASVAELLEQLGVPASQARVVFVNGRARPSDWTLEAGDEVGVFPPVGGG